MALTDTRVRALHGQAQKDGKAGKESDGGWLNFQDGKYWRLSYRFAGKQKTLSPGVYPDVSLKMARQARELLAQGIDPGEQRKADKAEAVRVETEQARTFRVVAMEYYRRKLSEKKELYRKQTLARLENRIFPSIGHIPISQLRPSDILAGLREVEERGSIYMAHRLAALVCQVCRYAGGYAPPRVTLRDHTFSMLFRRLEKFSVNYHSGLVFYIFINANFHKLNQIKNNLFFIRV